MSRLAFLGAGMAFAALSAASHAGSDLIGDGPSRTELDLARDKARAKAERETWEPTPETRQQRRARERRESKRRTPSS